MAQKKAATARMHAVQALFRRERDARRRALEAEMARIAAEKAEDYNEEVATYGQVQERKKQLLSLISSDFCNKLSHIAKLFGVQSS